MKPRISFCALSLFVAASTLHVGCGDTGGGAFFDGGLDATADLGGGDVAGDAGADADADADAGALDPACWDDAPALGVFALEGETTQIHPDAAWDGEAVWMAWNVANDDSEFVVRVGRVGCDGSWLVEPFDVSSSEPGNRIDPTVAVHDDRVLVVWQNDDGSGENNLSIVRRTFAVDGSDLDPSPAVLELVANGEAFAVNAWMADVATTSDGFLLAGAWADPTTETFQVFTQALAADGSRVGELRRLVPDAGETQVEPVIAVTDAGEIVVAWAEQFRDDGDRVRLARWAEGEDGGLTVEVIDGGLVADAVGGPTGLVAASTADGVVYVRPNGGETRALQGPPGAATAPGLAAVDGEVFIAWFQPIRGFTNDVFGGWLSGDTVTADGLSSDPVAAYPLTLTPVGERSVMIAWAAGDTSPLFTMQARVVSR